MPINWGPLLVVGGVLAGTVALSTISLGFVGDHQAHRLLEAMKPTTRLLCFAAITAPGTILALLLTVLASSQGWNHPFRSDLYDRIRQLTTLSILVIVAAVFLLVFLNVPIEEASSLSKWQSLVYYTVAVGSAVIGTLLIVTVLMLRALIVAFISAVDPHIDYSDALDGG